MKVMLVQVSENTDGELVFDTDNATAHDSMSDAYLAAEEKKKGNYIVMFSNEAE